jgi:pyruvate,orthophosphate dikinase
VQSYAVQVARLDPEPFDLPEEPTRAALKAMLAAYEAAADEPFPQDPATQLSEVLRSMARAWDGTTARLLRQAKGAPEDAGLGLVVQAMALGVGRGESGSGVIQFVDALTGRPEVQGRYLRQSQGRDALSAASGALPLTGADSLEACCPEAFAGLLAAGARVRERLREEMQVEFTLENGRLRILDGVRVPRSSRAAVRVAVALAEDGVIPRTEAILRVDPQALSELLHRQVDPRAPRDRIAAGIAASPGRRWGPRGPLGRRRPGEPRARRALHPRAPRDRAQDVRGMHAASAVVTVRGGITSHAAVVGRGLGVPCVVGCSDLEVDRRRRVLLAPGGRVIAEGDVVTVDGTTGEMLARRRTLLDAAPDAAFRTLLGWADQHRDIGVRANADTPADAALARRFDAEGIGLCRTEHMFFDGERVGPHARDDLCGRARRAARRPRAPPANAAGDFAALFRIMAGQPVCIRLFRPAPPRVPAADPPGDARPRRGLSAAAVGRRGAGRALREYNPMLGMRGVAWPHDP